jgi:hypothetical protein
VRQALLYLERNAYQNEPPEATPIDQVR